MRSRSSEKLPKYVYKQIIKGRTYYRFRKQGGGAVRLPDIRSPEFLAAYTKLLAEPAENIDRYSPGSVSFVIEAYQRSADFEELAEGTRRDYERYLARLDRSVGGKPIESIDAAYIFQIRDKLKATPVAANHTVAVIGSLFRFAIARQIVRSNPAAGIPRLKGGDGFARWMDEDVTAFRKSAGDMMRLALDLGLYTGQRLSDVIRLAWADYDGLRIRVTQQKTGARLSIPAHPDLRDALAVTARRGETILTTKSGLPFHSRVFSRDFRDARVAAGLPDGLSFHGLRHTAASRLAEMGATGPEIQSITGHRSLKLVDHYIKQASQELQADRAIALLPKRPENAKRDC